MGQEWKWKWSDFFKLTDTPDYHKLADAAPSTEQPLDQYSAVNVLARI